MYVYFGFMERETLTDKQFCWLVGTRQPKYRMNGVGASARPTRNSGIGPKARTGLGTDPKENSVIAQTVSASKVAATIRAFVFVTASYLSYVHGVEGFIAFVEGLRHV